MSGPTTVIDPSHPEYAEPVAGLEEAERGEGVVVSPEEIAHWETTGEPPPAVVDAE